MKDGSERYSWIRSQFQNARTPMTHSCSNHSQDARMRSNRLARADQAVSRPVGGRARSTRPAARSSRFMLSSRRRTLSLQQSQQLRRADRNQAERHMQFDLADAPHAHVAAAGRRSFTPTRIANASRPRWRARRATRGVVWQGSRTAQRSPADAGGRGKGLGDVRNV